MSRHIMFVRVALLALMVGGGATGCHPGGAAEEAPRDNEELTHLHDDDQADRADETSIDWSVVGPRDHLRLARVKEMYREGLLTTANDCFHAAEILQHGDVPEDFLLAHELCVIAIAMGRNDRETRWLAASAEDRFLMNIGRPQRFGTQFRSEAGGPIRLYPVDSDVTDKARHFMGLHTLAEAKAHEAEMNAP